MSYKEQTKHNIVIFSKILPNNQIITACHIKLQVQEMTMNKKLTMIGLTLDSEDLSFWYIWKKWFLLTTAAAEAAENHGDKWGLTQCFQWGIYTSIPTWTHSQNSQAAAEALSLKISSYGTSLKWSQRLSQSACK